MKLTLLDKLLSAVGVVAAGGLFLIGSWLQYPVGHPLPDARLSSGAGAAEGEPPASPSASDEPAPFAPGRDPHPDPDTATPIAMAPATVLDEPLWSPSPRMIAAEPSRAYRSTPPIESQLGKPVRAYVSLPPSAQPTAGSSGSNFRITQSPQGLDIEFDPRASIPLVLVPTPTPATANPNAPNSASVSAPGAGPSEAPSEAPTESPVAAEMADRIAEDFIRKVSPAPGSPSITFEQWEDATSVANERYRALYGVEQYLKAAREAMLQFERTRTTNGP